MKKIYLNYFSYLTKIFKKYNIIFVDRIIKNIALFMLDSLGIKYGIRTLDSLKLASAVFSSSYSEIDYFVSSDKKLLNIAKEYFQIINPEEL